MSLRHLLISLCNTGNVHISGDLFVYNNDNNDNNMHFVQLSEWYHIVIPVINLVNKLLVTEGLRVFHCNNNVLWFPSSTTLTPETDDPSTH